MFPHSELRSLAASIALGSIFAAACAAGPVWDGPTIQGDPLFFVQAPGASTATASLLYVPSEAPQLKSSTRQLAYEPGKDFAWKPGSREITLVPGSRIPFKTDEEMHPPPGSPHSIGAARGGQRHLFFGEGHFFTDLQAVADYATSESWTGTQTAPAAPGQLDRTLALLREKKPLAITVLGDSISTGANASGVVGAEPKQPGYPDLIAQALEKRFGSHVTLKNLSVGGKDSPWGLSQMDAVLATAPDLFVLAFGMNDASGRRKTEDYAALAKKMIEALHKGRPEAEVILVATMTGNSEWTASAPELYPAYRDALRSLTGAQVAMADVTAVWADVLKRKKFADLTGNGVNHPNDFGHRLYADVILSLFHSPNAPAK